MTRTQKIVLMALGLLVLVFALVVFHGSGQPDCVGDASNSRCKAGPGIKSLGTLTSPFAKGVKLPQPRYSVAPNAIVSVTIPAASDDMRSLKLSLTQGTQAQTRLVNVKPDTDRLAPQREFGRIPRADDDPTQRHTQNYVVTSGGATLTMQCLGPVPCVFENG